MTHPARTVVVDTMVISWLLDDRPNPLADRYRDLIGTAGVVLAFQTVAELRYGALLARWGELRRRHLERGIATLTVAQPDDRTVDLYAQLRADCHRTGHALGNKLHDGDRWIAATALRLNSPLVSHDGLFANAARLKLITATDQP
jgi:predicted nucleic acid-binding protein